MNGCFGQASWLRIVIRAWEAIHTALCASQQTKSLYTLRFPIVPFILFCDVHRFISALSNPPSTLSQYWHHLDSFLLLLLFSLFLPNAYGIQKVTVSGVHIPVTWSPSPRSFPSVLRPEPSKTSWPCSPRTKGCSLVNLQLIWAASWFIFPLHFISPLLQTVYNLALPEQWHMQTKMCICHAACRAIVWLEDTPSHIVHKLLENMGGCVFREKFWTCV